MLHRHIDCAPLRLSGGGLSALDPAEPADPGDDLLDRSGDRRAAAERAADAIRAKFGQGAIVLGRSIR
jgi:DNA polymerase-4